MSKINLVCIPFAGGNKYSYRPLLINLPEFISVTTLELPGRGGRVNEILLDDIDEMVEDMYMQILPFIDSEYIIYGHSMGALLSYLLCKKLQSIGDRLPIILFVSGFGGPSIQRKMKMHHALPSNAFKEVLKNLGGMSPELLDDPKVFEYYEPIIRSDFKAIERFKPRAIDEKLPFAIDVTVGTDEDISIDDVKAWEIETIFPLSFRRMGGGHFFIFDHFDSILEMIVVKLSQLKSNA